MTLDEFRATGRDVPDLGAIDHIAASGQSGPGRTYLAAVRDSGKACKACGAS